MSIRLVVDFPFTVDVRRPNIMGMMRVNNFLCRILLPDKLYPVKFSDQIRMRENRWHLKQTQFKISFPQDKRLWFFS